MRTISLVFAAALAALSMSARAEAPAASVEAAVVTRAAPVDCVITEMTGNCPFPGR